MPSRSLTTSAAVTQRWRVRLSRIDAKGRVLISAPPASGGPALRRRGGEILLRLREPPLLEADEPHALERAEMARHEPQHHVPLVERFLQIAPVHRDARQQIVAVGEVWVPLEAAQRDFEREIE